MTDTSYHLGVDLGTTFTAAAVARNGRAEPVTLGTSSVAVPSVLYLDGDSLVVGQPAARRAGTEPGRVAREFKRRVGDPTPVVVGGSPIPAELLMARLLAWVVDQVAATEGRPPESLAVTHPANWGQYKLDLFAQAIHHVDLQVDQLVPEPVAAATFYASQRDLPSGSVVAVYDLGGGTFDAALVRAEADGFGIVGRPDGVERLGGIDFDHAVLRHVAGAIDVDLDTLADEEPGSAAALTQLRQSCVEAKEALSAETDVAIPVMLPHRHTEVRLTRAEFEAMIRPALDETLVALRRAIGSAHMGPQQVATVLLVGGSSRIPLIGQLVTAALDLPVAVDARPKDAIPLGAALAASAASAASAPPRAPATSPASPAPDPTPPVVVGPPVPVEEPPEPVESYVPVVSQAAVPGPPTVPPEATVASQTPGEPPTAFGEPQDPSSPGPWRSRRLAALLVGGAAALLALGVVLAVSLSGGDGGGGGEEENADTKPDDTSTTTDPTDTTATTSESTEGSSGAGEPPEPLPGTDWNGAARTQFVEDCAGSDLVGTAADIAGMDPAEACGCIYDDISTSGTSFDDFNEAWSADEFDSSGPVASAMQSAVFSCVGLPGG